MTGPAGATGPVGSAAGPLAGLRVLELGGIGPAPFAGMLLAELGAEVVRVDRPTGPDLFALDPERNLLHRGKRSVLLDLGRAEAVAAALALVERADVLIEGFRPGVAERLGLGPDACHVRNPRLVYGRMTGWGQTGPLATAAGHDINYIGLTGLLDAIGPADGPPQVPLNVVGDFGGGATYLVIGVLAAVREAERTGRGQVVDAAVLDGVAHLLTAVHTLFNSGSWTLRRQHNLLDGGAPFYGVYRTADGRYVTVGALERGFYAALLSGLGLDEDPTRQYDAATWPATRARIAEAFLTRTQAEWVDHFAGTDACVAPVLDLREAADHPQVRARGSVSVRDGRIEAGPAPRFPGRTGGVPARSAPPPRPGQHTRAVLAEWGVPDPDGLVAGGAAVQSDPTG
jgi:alpha-methylacyl-CoA racemase